MIIKLINYICDYPIINLNFLAFLFQFSSIANKEQDILIIITEAYLCQKNFILKFLID